ncbi:hypothetical protein ENSA5_07430 [Enhygromyxa salina]|uniref:Putative restriction endonuclease domain-containing protein n=2 Tax=Enhygromyxa salina TaxID=215803 RepID=A0A2S9YHK3_9BACT|nr:hypothetical protein ENSA5_07430 [Enhygromyxa salina]
MTYAEYRALEREAKTKHEYLRGKVFAMTGGTLEHGRLAVRMSHLLTRELEARPCRVYSSDVRVRVDATDLDTYPDVSVVCGEPETAKSDAHALLNPIMLVEVLSDSTEAYDRGQKASHYRRIPSLRAYLLVSQHEPKLELQVRAEDGPWTLREAGAGERLVIEPLGIELDVDEVYRQPPAR